MADQSDTEDITDENVTEDRNSSTLGPAPKIKTLQNLKDALTNAFGNAPEGNAKTKFDQINEEFDNFGNKKILENPQTLEDALFGKNGVLANYSFQEHWEHVASKDTADNAIAQPDNVGYVHRFKTGEEPRQPDPAYETWQSNNGEWIQAYKNYHNLFNTAKDVIHTSRAVNHLVPHQRATDDQKKQARARHRELVQRTNNLTTVAHKAKLLAAAYDQSGQATNWVKRALYEIIPLVSGKDEAKEKAQANMTTLLGMACDTEKEALNLLEKADSIMEQAFKDMGLTALPSGGYRLPPRLNNESGLNYVLKAMALKAGGYRTYSVSMGGRLQGKTPGFLIEQAIASHFEVGGIPYAVEIKSNQKSSGQHHESAMQWLKNEMEKHVDDDQNKPKLKDCTPEARAQIIAHKLDQHISAGNRLSPAQKIILKCLNQQQKAAASRVDMEHEGSWSGKMHGAIDNTLDKLPTRLPKLSITPPSPVKNAERALEKARELQEQVQNTYNTLSTTKGKDKPETVQAKAHLDDVEAQVRSLADAHKALKDKEDTLKDNIAKAKKAIQAHKNGKENQGPEAQRDSDQSNDDALKQKEQALADAKKELDQFLYKDAPERYRAKLVLAAKKDLEKAVKAEEKARGKLAAAKTESGDNAEENKQAYETYKTQRTLKKHFTIPTNAKKGRAIIQAEEKLKIARAKVDTAKTNLPKVEAETRAYVEACNQANNNIVSSVIDNPGEIVLDFGQQENAYEAFRKLATNTSNYEWQLADGKLPKNNGDEQQKDALRERVQQTYTKLMETVNEARANDSPDEQEMKDMASLVDSTKEAPVDDQNTTNPSP